MSSVAENSINPQNIEADIRKNYYLRCSVNVNPLGVVWIKQKIVEMIVQITRVGLNGL